MLSGLYRIGHNSNNLVASEFTVWIAPKDNLADCIRNRGNVFTVHFDTTTWITDFHRNAIATKTITLTQSAIIPIPRIRI